MVRNVIHFKGKVIEELLRKITVQFMKWTAIAELWTNRHSNAVGEKWMATEKGG